MELSLCYEYNEKAKLQARYNGRANGQQNIYVLPQAHKVRLGVIARRIEKKRQE